jgi:Tol biopolymer transport system component
VYSTFSDAGTVYLRDLKTSRETQIASFPRRGAQQLAWSPDGRRIALYSGVDVRTGETDIEVMDSDGSNLINLTADPAIGNCTSPSWSPDGKRIVFACVPAPANPFDLGNDPPSLYVARADGTGGLKRLTNFWSQSPAWSPDGTKIAFQAWRGPFPTSERSRQVAEKAKSNYEIYVVRADGTGKQRLTNTAQNDENPEWSPDGAQIAFDSERDTTDDSSSLRIAEFETPSQIYVMNADGSRPTRTTNDAGQEQVRPHWIRQGLIAFFYYDKASSIEGMAFVRPQGSATIQIAGPYPNFDIYLTGG